MVFSRARSRRCFTAQYHSADDDGTMQRNGTRAIDVVVRMSQSLAAIESQNMSAPMTHVRVTTFASTLRDTTTP